MTNVCAMYQRQGVASASEWGHHRPSAHEEARHLVGLSGLAALKPHVFLRLHSLLGTGRLPGTTPVGSGWRLLVSAPLLFPGKPPSPRRRVTLTVRGPQWRVAVSPAERHAAGGSGPCPHLDTVPMRCPQAKAIRGGQGPVAEEKAEVRVQWWLLAVSLAKQPWSSVESGEAVNNRNTQ